MMLLLVFLSVFCHVEAGTVDSIYIRDKKPTLKGSDIQLVCDISKFSSVDPVEIYKSDNLPPSSIDSLTGCVPSSCVTTIIDRYTFSADTSHVYINITKVNRSVDQKWWTCATGNDRKDLLISVITVPTSLQYHNPPSQDQDLAQNELQLNCRTGCSYPKPTITWYYSETENDNLKVWSLSGGVSGTSGCSDSEEIYSTTLFLPRYSTFQGNLEKTVRFKCSIQSFAGMPLQLYTDYSRDVQFAVKVSSATLKDRTNTVSKELLVVSGENKTLTCDTGINRPAATIVWYIGTDEKQRSTSNAFTFSPVNGYHNKKVYCKAFNIQPENQAVTSYKSTLQVKVQISSVTLMDGSNSVSGQLQVVSGESKTLTCDTDVSRPAAMIVWYIGTEEKQRSTSNNFTFTPNNSDHDKKVYCKAFNTQPESQAVYSIQSELYVNVYARTPTLSNQTAGNLVLLENDSITMECITSATRPAVTVTWLKGSSNLTNTKNTNIAHGNLVTVKSVVTFTPEREDDGKSISCQTFIPGQMNRPRVQQRITVYWPPSTPSVPVTQFPFFKGDTGKNIYCSSNDYGNPASAAEWTKQYGAPDSNDSRRLNLPTLTSYMNGSPVSCQLINNFTQVKGLTKISSTVRLNVEYTPVVQIMIGGIITNSVTRNEGQQLSAICNATGNPTPTVKWNGPKSSNSNLIFNDIERTDHGRYTCRAEAISTKYPDLVSEEILIITVNYAPEVTVVVSKTEPLENASLKITCNATGRPNKYIYTSIAQTWMGITIPNSHLPVNGPFDGLIEIKKLKLDDSGTYTCHVNNGIPDNNQILDQIGKSDVSVKVSPKVLLEEGHTFAGVPGKSINISIPFYSYPDIRTVKFQFKNGTEIDNSDKYTTSYTRQNVTSQFYGKPLKLKGYVAVLNIVKEEQQDFVNYTLALENDIGQPLNWNIFHISESLPLAPKFINFTGFAGDVPTFLLFGNFNGGRLQTFIVETSVPPSTEWQEVLRFNETDETFKAMGDNFFKFNISGLSPNTYTVRVLAENSLGQINESLASEVQFTIVPSDKDKLGTSPPIAAIVGGLMGAVLAGVIVLVVIIFLKRRTKTKGDSSSVLNRRGQDSDDSDDDVMTENQAYVSADEVGISNERSVPEKFYAQPTKPIKKASPSKGNTYASGNEDQSKLYAVPDKKVVKKNQKKQKNVKEDIYENASELTPVKTEKGGRQVYDENPYENQEESKPKVNRNKDGLIYADLTFNDQQKGQKKLVIHGLDSMTKYVEVDFTKKADPLPDSDEENK